MRNFIENRVFYLLTITLLFPFYIHGPILILTTVLLIFYHRDEVILYVQASPWLNLFFMYVIVSSLLNWNFLGAIIPLGYFAYFLIFSHYLNLINFRDYLKLLEITSIGSIPVALFAFYEYLAYSLQHGYGVFYIFKYANIQTRAESTFFNANYYGLFCLFVVLISMYLLFKGGHTWMKKIGYLIAIVLNIISMVLTGSRTFLPILAGVIVWFILWAKREYLVPFAIVSGLGIVYLIVFPETIPRLTSIVYAFEDRFDIWSVGWKLFLLNPFFGKGDMAYFNRYHLYTDKGDMHAHQLFLNALLNYGILGTSILCIACFDYIKSVWYLFRSGHYQLEFALISSIILVVLAHGLVDVSIFWTQTAYYFLIITLPVIKLMKQSSKISL